METTPQAQQDFSVNSIAKLLNKDRRTIDKAIVGIMPTRVQGKTKFYRLEDVEQALRDRKDQKLRDEKLREEIIKLRTINEEAAGKLIAKAKVCESIRRIMPAAATLLEQRLVNEYPTGVAGLDVAQARVYGKRLCDEIMAFFQQLASEWT